MSDQAVPKQYQTLLDKYPEYMKAVQAVGETARAQGPLTDKTAHLIQMAAAVAIRSQGAVHSHARRALATGASPEEVRHALILLTSTLGFPTVSAALSWVGDILD